MKEIKIILFSFAFLLAGITFASCGSSSTSDNAKEGKEYTSAYICPMHCKGSGSDAAGTCPVCKMDYVANKEHGTDNHDHDHDGHDHGSHDGHDH